MPRPRTEPTIWLGSTAVCLTCRRLRLRAGLFPEAPAVIAHGRDCAEIITHARRHEALYLQRDEAHAIEIHVREVTIRPLKILSLTDLEAGRDPEGG